MLKDIILINKHSHSTSQQIVTQVKSLLDIQKAGHIGTLDPMATGMLPILLGKSTKLARYLLLDDKMYMAVIQLGTTTDTGDAEGIIIQQSPSIPVFNILKIQKVINSFKGQIQQIPPMYSAIKKNGTPLYKLARAGIDIRREARQVNIHHIELIDYEPECGRLSLYIWCSKGTYIRSLAVDIGSLLECGASLLKLERLRCSYLPRSKMISIQELQEISLPHRRHIAFNTESLFYSYSRIYLSDLEYKYFLHTGQLPYYWEGRHTLYNNNYFLGIVDISNGAIKSKVLITQNPI